MEIKRSKNIMHKQILIASLALLMGGNAIAAESEASGFYLGGSAGAAHQKAHSVQNEKSDPAGAWSVYGGYNFNPYFGVELAYQALGESEAGKHSADSRAVSADLVGKLPLSDAFGIYGKVGTARVDTDFRGLENDREQKTALKLGLGAEYRLSESVGLRAELTQYRNTPSHESADGSLGASSAAASLGLVYHF